MKKSLFLLAFLVIAICGTILVAGENIPGSSPRILSLCSAVTHILLQLHIPPAGIDTYGKAVPGTENIPIAGKGSALSIEQLTALKIDTIIGWNYQSELEKTAQSRQIILHLITPVRLTEYPALIQKVGKIANREQEAEELAKKFQSELEKYPLPPADTPETKIYFELYSPGKIAGNDSYLGDLLRRAGGRSIVERGGLISSEKVIIARPEVIFYVEGFTSAEELRQRPGFSTLPAVKNNRIYAVKRQQIIEGIAPIETIKLLKSKIQNL
ncbi:MAG: ABC transporter substrate-binding protein [Victivallaceae bacterium]